MIYRPEIFDRLVYRGWIVEGQWGVMDAWFDSTENLQPLHFDKTLVYNQITSAKKSIQQKEISERVNLMARFWTKAQSYDLSEEKFILLWTILEIYPMMDTTNIKPIYEVLSDILGLESGLIDEKLGIRQLYRQRCDLVHQGKFTTQAEEIIELFDKLENILYEIIRNLIDLPYNHSLDHYL
jgi:hypothetical protein